MLLLGPYCLSFIEPIFAWNVPLVSLIFLKWSLVLCHFCEDQVSLWRELLFFSISLHWSLRKAFLSLLAIVWNSAFRCLYLSFSPLLFTSFLFTAICKRIFYTWTSPDSQHRNMIDYILCSQRWRRSIQSAKTRPGADCGSGHEFLIAKFRLKLRKVGKTTRPFRYEPIKSLMIK